MKPRHSQPIAGTHTGLALQTQQRLGTGFCRQWTSFRPDPRRPATRVAALALESTVAATWVACVWRANLRALQVAARLLYAPLTLCFLSAPATAAEPRTAEPVTLQLKWTHAFQFAGYYAALAKGYYQDAGLDVRIVEATPGVDPIQKVVEGEAQFGVGTSSLLLERKAGKPVVVLAVIFQHSPYVLIARQESATQDIHDLVGKRIMLEPQSDELVAYLQAEGIPLDRFTRVEHSYDPQDLIDGRVDAIAGYVTNQPYFLDRAHFAYQMYTPRSAGIDFYGDNLFTTEGELRAHPARVKAFRAASLRGWQYAMEHPEEIVNVIVTRYSQRHSRDYFLFEARQMVPLLRPELIEVGYMYPGRWRHIADTYASIGMLKVDFDLGGFLYDPNPPPPDLRWLYALTGLATLVLIVVSAVAAYIYRINARLRQEASGRRQAEETSRQSEERFTKAFQTSPYVITITRAEDGKFIEVNAAFTALTGFTREEALADSSILLKLWVNEADRQRVVTALKNGQPVVSQECLFRMRNGAVITGLISAQTLELDHDRCILSSINDITAAKRAEAERAALESQLQQAQKMESVGRLAGGVAHEFNNQLMGIMNYVELCRDDLPPEHPIRAYLDEITSGAQRSANITRQLLAFARKQPIAPEVLDLNDALLGTLKMLQRLLGEDIDLIWMPGADLWPVRMDPGQVNQILVDLCVNARDAIVGVGKVTIETRNTTLAPAYGSTRDDATPGDYVLLSVGDNGCGMSKDVLGHVFEPFFSTKEVGKGTGLGLATVYGIVNQNAGRIEVASDPGKGTTFRIYLPRTASAAHPEATLTGATELPHGTETILLVEDERAVRVTTHQFLELLGYTLLVAETPEEALRLAEAYPGTLNLLVSDVVMPGMSGRDLASRLAAVRPSMRCLFISGYAASTTMDRGGLDADAPFLAKPFSRSDLARKVRDVLEA